MNIETYKLIIDTIKFHLQDIGYESSIINNEEVLPKIDHLDIDNDTPGIKVISHHHLGLGMFDLKMNDLANNNDYELILTVHLENMEIDFDTKEKVLNSIIKTLCKEIELNNSQQIAREDFLAQISKLKVTLLILSNSVVGSLITENIFTYENKPVEINSFKNMLKNELKLFVSKIEINSIFDYYSIKDNENEKFKIGVASRTFVASSKSSVELGYRGKVYTAKLKDLVNLFERKGKLLFIKNIRLGIENLMNVDTAINDTLLNKPQEFWFLNNGITMLVSFDKVDDNNNEYIVLKNNEADLLTVINGAQTITSATNFYLKEKLYLKLNSEIQPTLEKLTQKKNTTTDFTSKEEKKLVAFEKVVKDIEIFEKAFQAAQDQAYVMLKLVEFDDNNVDLANKIPEITVSLNRQKPVGPTDIAYTLPVIYEINNLYKNNINNESLKKYLFSIVRRGDVSSTNNNIYTLNVLPRILKAVNDSKPGKAMSIGIKTLLKISEDNNSFVDKSIFPMNQNGEDCISEEFFEQNYKYVNFGMKLYEELEKKQNIIDKSNGYNFKIEEGIELPTIEIEGFNKFIKYSRYVMLYIIIKSLNDKQDDFSKWMYSRESVTEFLDQETYYEIAYKIACRWEKYLEKYADDNEKSEVKGKEKWQINVFKKDLVIDEILNDVHNEIKVLIIDKLEAKMQNKMN